MRGLLFCVVFLAGSLFYGANSIDLQQAIQKGWAGASAKIYKDTSADSDRSLKVWVTNLRPTPLRVRIVPGLLFHPEDETLQDMVVTEEQWLVVAPLDTAVALLYAMCGERADGSPVDGDAFTPGGLAAEQVCGLAAFIAAKNYQGTAGQEAMWVITDRSDIANVTGIHEDEVIALRNKVSDLLGLPPEALTYTPERLANTATFTVEFQYLVRKPGMSSLQLYDAQGQLMATIFSGNALQKGMYTFTLRVKNFPLVPGRYVLQLQIDGTVAKEKQVHV